MAFIYLYVNGSFWYATEIEDEGTAVSAPSRMSPSSEYGSWSGWYDLTYNHIVKTPTSPTQTSSATYHSYLPRRERLVKTTTYSNDWAAQLVRNGTTFSYTVASDASWLVTFDGQYDINIYYTPKSSSQSSTYEYEYGSWRGDSYTLSAVSFEGYTQNNYKGTSASYTGSKAPGSNIWAPDLNKWDGPFPFENVTWTPDYSKKLYTLTLDPGQGSGGPSKIYYWDPFGWFSDPDTADSHKITRIELPSRPGYDFSGYGNIIDSEGKIINTISSNTSLTASWQAKSFVVTLNLNNPRTDDGKVPSCNKDHIDVTYDSAYGTLPTPTRDGYTFAGWYTQATGGAQITSSTIYKTDGNSTIYAHWTINQYTVTARNSEGILSVKVGNNPSGTTSTGTYNYWDQVTISAEVDEETEPSPGTQYLFSEWLDLNNLSPSGAPQSVSDQNPYTFRVMEDTDYEGTTYSGARTYTVTLTSNNFIVKYGYYDGEERVSEHTITGLLYGDIIKLWAIPRNDYLGYCEFDGWFNGNLKVIPVNKFADESDYQIEIKGNMTLTAKASLIVPRVEIKLKNNGYNHTNQNGGVVSINYIDGYGYNTGKKLVNPGETKSVYVLRELANDSSLVLKVESTEYGYQFNDWEKGSWSSTDPEWQARTITQEGTYEANFDLWNKDGATWKSYYVFVKTKDENLPWKIVKEIDVRVKEDNEEKWKESSKAPSQP